LPESQPSSWRRLHPAAMAVWAGEILGRLGLGLVALIFVGDELFLVVLGLLVASLGGVVVRYVRFSYRVESDALVLQGGLLRRYRRVLPIARIQSVDVVQKLTHRAFGVVELRIEVAGGQQTEAALSALHPEEAEALRVRLLSDLREARPDVPPLARVGAGELLLAGLTGGRVAVFAALLGYLQELLPDDVLIRFAERVGDTATIGLVTVLALAGLFVLVSMIFSIVATLFVYWDFMVRMEGNRIVVTRGLLEKRRAVVPLARLQAVRLDENLVRRVLGLASLRAVTAGYGARSQEQEETSMLLPVGRREAALRLAGEVLGTPAQALFEQLSPATHRAFLKRVLYAGVAGLGATAVGIVLIAQERLALVPLPVLALAGAMVLPVASWRALGHTLAGRLAVTRSGALVRRTTFVPVHNVQHLSLTVSPLQRLLGLATVRLAIPKAEARAFDLDQDRAEALFEALSSSLWKPWTEVRPSR
jgi:putative membrane protein